MSHAPQRPRARHPARLPPPPESQRPRWRCPPREDLRLPAPRFERLVIYGIGLLGGSVGLAVRERGLAREVVGLGRSRERLEQARAQGALDTVCTDVAGALRGADALVLALPPRLIREGWAALAPLLEPGAFVTDVGSVKRAIVEEAERALSASVLFVGAHPMAGGEKSGAEHARADLYVCSPCLLTPTPRTAPAALELGREFWQALGARTIELDPAEHDRLLAGISHLPHLLAAALMRQVAMPAAPAPAALGEVCGPSLRDMTRIAASDPGLWSEIFSENQPALLEWLDALLVQLQEWRGALAAGDAEALTRFYAAARDARLALNGCPSARK